jgi:hypothetical protein
MEITGKIRYNDNGAMGTIRQLSDDEIEVHFPGRPRSHHSGAGRGLL